MPLLTVSEVTKRYGEDGSEVPVQVLNGVSFEVQNGESVAITGPSGSGKTTLLNIIGTLDRPSQGRVLLNGQNLSELAESDLAVLRNRHIGFVFQAHYLMPQCSVLENVLVPTLVDSDHARRAAAPARARKLLDRVGLGDRLAHRPSQLSGGEQQRVAVVRALINNPELLLADEPTGALDHTSAQGLGQLLLELNRENGVTLILVTHALDLARQMQRSLELQDGRLSPAQSAAR